MPRRQPPPPLPDTATGGGDPPSPATALDPAALWQAVCHTTRDYVLVIDRAGTIMSCNRVDEGMSADAVIGHDVAGFTTPESAQQFRRAIGAVFDTGRPQAVESSVPRPDGGCNSFSIRLGPVLVAGRPAAVVACCENTLPLKTSEQTLQRERTLLKRLLKLQERERQLVSYEIHDGLAQYLAGAMMHLQACEHAAADAPGQAELREGLRLLRAATDEARRLIGGLRPPSLDELGIIAAVESLAADARVDVPRVEFTHSLPASRLPADLETTIFRIVQESLSNVRRHAQANAVRIRLEQSGTAVRVIVEDDGVGFDPTGLPGDRFGVEGIRPRGRLLGGEPTISSGDGHGTRVSVELPIEGSCASLDHG